MMSVGLHCRLVGTAGAHPRPHKGSGLCENMSASAGVQARRHCPPSALPSPTVDKLVEGGSTFVNPLVCILVYTDFFNNNLTELSINQCNVNKLVQRYHFLSAAFPSKNTCYELVNFAAFIEWSCICSFFQKCCNLQCKGKLNRLFVPVCAAPAVGTCYVVVRSNYRLWMLLCIQGYYVAVKLLLKIILIEG